MEILIAFMSFTMAYLLYRLSQRITPKEVKLIKDRCQYIDMWIDNDNPSLGEE